MTQEELAETLRTSQNQIWKYESGRSMPGGDMLIALAKALDTSTDFLLGLSDNESIQIDDLTADEIALLVLYRSKTTEIKEKLFEVAKVL